MDQLPESIREVQGKPGLVGVLPGGAVMGQMEFPEGYMPESIREMQGKPDPVGMLFICSFSATLITALIIAGFFR